MLVEMDTPELVKYVDDFMRRAIASHLKIRRKDLFASTALQEQVKHYLITIKAIAATPKNDDAVDALMELTQKPTSRARLIRDIEICYEKLSLEVAGYERMLEMLRLELGQVAIWDFLRSRVPIGSEFDDDWIRSADAWILRGEAIPVPMGSVELIPMRVQPKRSS